MTNEEIAAAYEAGGSLRAVAQQAGLSHMSIKRIVHRAGLTMHRRLPPQHGTRALYVQGCRCQPCTDAATAYTRTRQVIGLADDDPRHGSMAGYVRGCRCEPCNSARREYQRAWRAYRHRPRRTT